MDSENVIVFFEHYLSIVNDKPKEKKKATDSVKNRIAPSSSPSTQQTQNAAKKSFPSKDIKQFQSDLAKGKYKGREAEVKAIINDFEQSYLNNKLL